MRDKLRPFLLVFILVFISQPVFASILPCSMDQAGAEHSVHAMQTSGDNDIESMNFHGHEGHEVLIEKTLSDCCNQIDCELMHCVTMTAMPAKSFFSVNPFHSVIDLADSLIPILADISVSNPPPIFR